MKVEEADIDVSNFVGSSKVTRSGRLFSPEISPPTIQKPVVVQSASTSATVLILTPVITPVVESFDTRGKEVTGEPARTEAPKKIIVETSKQEIEEILKIIKKSDYNIVEQLGQTPSKISMLSLLLCFEAHAKALTTFLKTAHVPQETSADQFKDCVASLTVDNGLGFSDADLTAKGRNRNDALHV